VSRTGGFGAAQLLHALRARFLAAWRTIPRHDRRRWMTTAAAGVVGMFALMAVLVAVGKALVAAGSLAWEADFLRRLAADGPFSFSTAVWFQTFGTDITLWILVLLTAGIAVWNDRPLTALSIVLAYIVVDLVVRLGWLLWDRARPDVLYGGVTAPAFHAFPSGHTGKTVAVYGILIWTWMRSAGGWPEKLCALALLGFIATVVPLGRMTMGVHWPSDIIGGWLLGAVWLGYLVHALRYERAATTTPPAPAAAPPS
jgi:membrane-associated phospholipid phosphatase